jgi:hypothetical protein
VGGFKGKELVWEQVWSAEKLEEDDRAEGVTHQGQVVGVPAEKKKVANKKQATTTIKAVNKLQWKKQYFVFYWSAGSDERRRRTRKGCGA